MGETLVLHEFWSNWDRDGSIRKLRTFLLDWRDRFLIKGFVREMGPRLCSELFVAVHCVKMNEIFFVDDLLIFYWVMYVYISLL